MKENNDDNITDKEKSNTGMKNVVVLGIVSFFTDFSTEMILGILPLFVVSNLGAPKSILGAIEGSAELTSYAFRLVSGSLSDKIGKRKIFVILGYAISTISKPFFTIASGWIQAFIIRAGDRIGKGIRTAPRDALIADSIHESVSGRAFGIHRTIDQMGAIVGPITAFALLQVMDIRGVFLVSLIPGAIAVIILILFVKEVVPPSIKNVPNKTVKIFSNFGILLKQNRSFVLLLVITGIFSLGAFNYSFILLKASYDLGIEKNTVPLIYAAINVSHTLVGIPVGILSDKIGKEKTLLLGYCIFVISSLLMLLLDGRNGVPILTNIIDAYTLAAVFGLYIGISETLQRAIIPRYVSSELRGTAYGLYNLVVGVGFFISNIVFGYLWDRYTLTSAITYSLIFSSTAIIGMIIFISKNHKIDRENNKISI